MTTTANAVHRSIGLKAKKNRSALALASAHSFSTPAIEEIYYITSSSETNPQEPIKLLEVNKSTLEVGIQPVCFSATDAIPFSSIVVEVTPKELTAIKEKKLVYLADGLLGSLCIEKLCRVEMVVK